MSVGALRGYLHARNALPADSLIAMVPLSLRPTDPESGGSTHSTQRRRTFEIAKKGYSAYSAGDAETATSFFDDDIEWITPGNSSVSGTVHGKAEGGGMWTKLAEKSTTTTPEHLSR